jgi:WD40 repeat protein
VVAGPAGFCGNCGRPHTAEEAFCGNCGESLRQTSAPPQSAFKPVASEQVPEPADTVASVAPASLPADTKPHRWWRSPWLALLVIACAGLAVLIPFIPRLAGHPWSAVPGNLEASSPPPDNELLVSAIAFSGNGEFIGAGTHTGIITVWRSRDGQVVASHRARSARIESLSLNEDGSLVAAGFRSGIVVLTDLRLRAEPGVFKLAQGEPSNPSGYPLALSFQPGGQVVLCFDADYGLLRFLALSSGSQYPPIRFAPRRTTSASLSNADQRFLALGDADSGSVEVFDLLIGRSLGTVSGGGGAVHAIAISPDGTRVAAAQAYSLFSLWDVGTRMQLSMLDGPPPVAALAFSSDGRTLASGGQGLVVIWDAISYRELRRLDLKAAPISY